MDRLVSCESRAYLARMPDLDLGPEDYSVKGRKEPILHPNWKIGVLAIVIVFLIAWGLRLIYPAYSDAVDAIFPWLATR